MNTVVTIVGDAYAEARFLLQATAVTIVEDVTMTEDAVWCAILKHFHEQTDRIRAGAPLYGWAEINAEESERRQQLDRDQRRDANEIVLVMELVRHGCVAAWEEYAASKPAHALLHEPPPPPCDDAWKRLPTMVDVDYTTQHPERYTAAAAEDQLRRVAANTDGVESRASVETVRLTEREAQDRKRIEDESASGSQSCWTWHRLTRDGLAAIEARMEEEHRAVLLARMPVELRLAFCLWPCVHQEASARAMIVNDSGEAMERLQMESGAEKQCIILTTECTTVAALILHREAVARDRTLFLSRIRTHAADRMRTWLRWSQRRKRLHQEYDGVDRRAADRAKQLLHRYSVKWFMLCIEPKQRRARHDLLLGAVWGAVCIEIQESEERWRNEAIETEMLERTAFEDAFLTEKEERSAAKREAQLQHLHTTTVATHRQLVLWRWFSAVRERKRKAKTEWLQHATEARLTKRYWLMWCSAPPVLRTMRPVLQHVHTAVSPLQQCDRLQIKSQEGVDYIQLEESFRWNLLVMWASEEQLLACHAAQMRLLDQLEVANHRRLAVRVFSRWTTGVLQRRPYLRVHWLLHQSTTRCVGQFMEKWHTATVIAQLGRTVVCIAGILDEESNVRSVLTSEEASLRLRILSICGRVRWRQEVVAAVDVLQAKSQCALSQQSWLAWSRLWRDRQGDNVTRSEAVERKTTEDLEAAEWSEVCRVGECDMKRISLVRSHGEHILLMEQRSVLCLASRHYRRWHRLARRRLLADEVTRRGRLASYRRWFSLWMRHSIMWPRALARLDVLRRAAEHRLTHRYFQKLMPHVVRLAKVSRAKQNLEKAQSAARLLAMDVTSSAAQRSILPPLRNGRAADGGPFPPQSS